MLKAYGFRWDQTPTEQLSLNKQENHHDMKISESQKIQIQKEIMEMNKTIFEDPNNHWKIQTDQEIQKLKSIVEKIGWPTISAIGSTAASQFWSLTIDSITPNSEFHESCLRLMKANPEAAEHTSYIAEFEDKLRVRNGKPQLYGTQFRINEKGISEIIQPIEDMSGLNKRRAEMNLEDFESFEIKLAKIKWPPTSI